MLRYLSEGKRQQNIGTEISLFRGYFLSFLFLFGEWKSLVLEMMQLFHVIYSLFSFRAILRAAAFFCCSSPVWFCSMTEVWLLAVFLFASKNKTSCFKWNGKRATVSPRMLQLVSLSLKPLLYYKIQLWLFPFDSFKLTTVPTSYRLQDVAFFTSCVPPFIAKRSETQGP